MGFDPHAQQHPYQGGGEIPSTGTAHKTRIVVKGEHGRQTMLAQKLRHHFRQAFGVEVSPNGPAQPDGGARIHEIGDFHHMLPFALGIGGHGGGVFEVEFGPSSHPGACVAGVWVCDDAPAQCSRTGAGSSRWWSASVAGAPRPLLQRGVAMQVI